MKVSKLDLLFKEDLPEPEPPKVEPELTIADVHMALAKEVFGVGVPTQEQRQAARVMNFGSLYGGSEQPLGGAGGNITLTPGSGGASSSIHRDLTDALRYAVVRDVVRHDSVRDAQRASWRGRRR